MEGDSKIGEVRGILPHQGVEPIMQEALDEKLKDFGTEADAYRKKSSDMKILTALEQKREQDEPFTKDDLVFLYEINSSTKRSDYKTDPRIAELRKDRNTEEDMLVIFECTKEEIAYVPSDITENTKAYVGQLEPGIFQKLPETLEHVYTSFPGKKIRRESVEIGGKSKEQLISEMEASGIDIDTYEKSIMDNPDFVVGSSREEAKLVRLTVADLGFKTGAITAEIYKRAQALGLELCPPDTGPNYLLQYKDQSLRKVHISMKQIRDFKGYRSVFCLGRSDDGLWLNTAIAESDGDWGRNDEFVFRFRKTEA